MLRGRQTSSFCVFKFTSVHNPLYFSSFSSPEFAFNALCSSAQSTAELTVSGESASTLFEQRAERRRCSQLYSKSKSEDTRPQREEELVELQALLYRDVFKLVFRNKLKQLKVRILINACTLRLEQQALINLRKRLLKPMSSYSNMSLKRKRRRFWMTSGLVTTTELQTGPGRPEPLHIKEEYESASFKTKSNSY
ncbi:hypothetical protein INR49_012888 [Caranx melampygus]|nr:hypothetical protein INR49_012888 [Caranx melampygus]